MRVEQLARVVRPPARCPPPIALLCGVPSAPSLWLVVNSIFVFLLPLQLPPEHFTSPDEPADSLAEDDARE